jgi:hypothetical protein
LRVHRESVVVREADAICIQQDVVDARIRVQPGEQLEELRMKRWLAAGELKNLDPPFAVDYALNTSLQIRQRHRV